MFSALTGFTPSSQAIECVVGEPFAGAVKKITEGSCKGEWGLHTYIGWFYAINLPAEYQAQYYKVQGCMERKAQSTQCSSGAESYPTVEIDWIAPD